LYWLLPLKGARDQPQEQRPSPDEKRLPVVNPSESPPSTGGRNVSGSPVFVAASRLDEETLELTFEQALILARLVIECSGAPAAVRKMSSSLRHVSLRGLYEGLR
jgi:hypothetical protein